MEKGASSGTRNLLRRVSKLEGNEVLTGPPSIIANVGLLQHVAELVRTVGRIHVDKHHSSPGRGVLQQDPLHAVAGPDAGAIARPQAETGQTACRAGHFAVQFPPRQSHILVAHYQRFAVRKSGGGIGDSLGNGLFQKGHGCPAHIAERRFREWQ
jgi:hypothetical protein